MSRCTRHDNENVPSSFSVTLGIPFFCHLERIREVLMGTALKPMSLRTHVRSLIYVRT